MLATVSDKVRSFVFPKAGGDSVNPRKRPLERYALSDMLLSTKNKVSPREIDDKFRATNYSVSDACRMKSFTGAHHYGEVSFVVET